MKFFGSEDNGIINMFMRVKPTCINIYRENCDSGYDRQTGKYIKSKRIKMDSCGIFKPIIDREIVQDGGIERSKGRAYIFSQMPVYSSDQRDNASADILYMKSNYWKVMESTEMSGYWKAKVELMHEDECDGLCA